MKLWVGGKWVEGSGNVIDKLPKLAINVQLQRQQSLLEAISSLLAAASPNSINVASS